MRARRTPAPLAALALLTTACGDAPTAPRAAAAVAATAAGPKPPTAAASLALVGAGTLAALAVNDAGQTVGYADDADAQFGVRPYAATASGAVLLTMSTPGASGEANAVNAAGVIVGSEYGQASEGPFLSALRWASAAAAPTRLAPGCASSGAEGINDAGTVAGDCDGAAVVWEGPALTMRRVAAAGECESSTALAINARGDVAGTCDGTARIWLAAGGHADVGAQARRASSTAYALNDRGDAVGRINDRAVLWSGGRVTYLPGLSGGEWALAAGIDDQGRVVGQAYDRKAERYVPVIWVGGKLGVLPSAPGVASDGFASAIVGGRVAGSASGTAAVWTLTGAQ